MSSRVFFDMGFCCHDLQIFRIIQIPISPKRLDMVHFPTTPLPGATLIWRPGREAFPDSIPCKAVKLLHQFRLVRHRLPERPPIGIETAKPASVQPLRYRRGDRHGTGTDPFMQPVCPDLLARNVFRHMALIGGNAVFQHQIDKLSASCCSAAKPGNSEELPGPLTGR